ncbi:PREDICTED: toll-like receptor 2 isoform X1 [Poecilia mexicana]|uniref:toll-like receptor 2 isoform X1 n=1 Tax=Poecilia mexicana TaxID=48701 RepID=UPI00072EAFD6|nr:PREDICTED: toll-like receptor 2 isoform X1 [Poecilia mexicana]
MRRLTSGSLALLLLLVPLIRGQEVNGDDGRPTCRRCDLHHCCNCSHSGFTRVPMVTDQALRLDLSFNNITNMTKDDLMGHSRLRALDLHANGLAEIHPSAFDSLWSLEELDLSDNQLTVLNPKWFNKLELLQHLNLLNNPYSFLGSPSLFLGLSELRRLMFGGPDLKELRREDLSGVTHLDELTVHANNLDRYDSGTFGDIWPLGRVTLSLHGPFLTNPALAAAVLNDVCYPETRLTLSDLHLAHYVSVQPFKDSINMIRYLSLRNVSLSDEACVSMLALLDGVPLSSLSIVGLTLTGEGRWVTANRTDLRSMDEFFASDVTILDILKFAMVSELQYLLQYQKKLSIINAKLFLLSCYLTKMMVNTLYLDVSDNLLTDLTLTYMLCDSEETLQELRVLNISGNLLKSLSTLSRLVTKLTKLTQLDISRTSYNSMPSSCSWPSTLRYLNISRAKLTFVTPCLPKSLQVLDLSFNDLKEFVLTMPILRELHLSGNKFLRLPAGGPYPNLQTLTIQSNTLNAFSLSDLQSYRRLENLEAGHNKFVCSCEFITFLHSQLTGSGDVKITDKHQTYVCDSPLYLQGEAVSQVNLSIIQCQPVLFVSVSCGVALLLGILVAGLLWRCHAFWFLKMTWAWLKAKRSSQRRRRHRNTEGTDPLLSFDAFVSYSEQDASWVENFLVPEMEEPSDSDSENPTSPLTLCLHKRDFLPGHWIMDNIMSAIERSRRTVFVLSENFVQSDWCRYELDFSHFWLFEAGGDTAILILLEPLSKDDVPKRFCKLRKLMSSTTYLEWPQEEERRPEFWRSLRNALRGDDEQEN